MNLEGYLYRKKVMLKMRNVILVLLLINFSIPFAFAKLYSTVEGPTVRIVLKNSRSIRGELMAVQDTIVYVAKTNLDEKRTYYPVPWNNILKITLIEDGHLAGSTATGAGVGLLVGVALDLLLSPITEKFDLPSSQYKEEKIQIYFILSVMGAGFGAITGLIKDIDKNIYFSNASQNEKTRILKKLSHLARFTDLPAYIPLTELPVEKEPKKISKAVRDITDTPRLDLYLGPKLWHLGSSTRFYIDYLIDNGFGDDLGISSFLRYPRSRKAMHAITNLMIDYRVWNHLAIGFGTQGTRNITIEGRHESKLFYSYTAYLCTIKCPRPICMQNTHTILATCS